MFRNPDSVQKRIIWATHQQFLLGIAKTVGETCSSVFNITKDTFDAVPISVSFASKIELVFVTGSLK